MTNDKRADITETQLDNLVHQLSVKTLYLVVLTLIVGIWTGFAIGSDWETLGESPWWWRVTAVVIMVATYRIPVVKRAALR